MGYPEPDQDEPIILKSRNVRYKSISFDAVLTGRRICLTSSRNNVIPFQEINLASIRDIKTEENAIRDHFLLLSLVTDAGEKHQAVLTFARQAGVERKRECNEWAKKIRSLIPPSTPVAAPPDVPDVDRKPPVKRDSTVQGTAAITSPAKKKTEITRHGGKVIEKGPVDAEPEETITLPTGAFCSACGSRVPLKSTFCNKCGTPLRPHSGTVQGPQQGVSAEPVSVYPKKFIADIAKTETVPPPVPEPTIKKRPETVLQPVPGVIKEQKTSTPPSPKPGIAKKPETLYHPAPKPVVTKERGSALPPPPQPIITTKPETVPPPVPEPIIKKRPETVQQPVPGVLKEQKSSTPPSPKPGIAKKPEALHYPVPKPVVTTKPETVPLPAPEPITTKQPETVPLPTQAVITREQVTALLPATEPVVTTKPETVPLPAPEPITTKQPETVPLSNQPVITREQVTALPPATEPVVTTKPETVPLPTQPVITREQVTALPPPPLPEVTTKPETVPLPAPEPVSTKQPETVPLPTQPVITREQVTALPPPPLPEVTTKPETVPPPAPEPVRTKPDDIHLPAGSRRAPPGELVKKVILTPELPKKDSEPRIWQPPSPVQPPTSRQQSELSSAASFPGSSPRVVWPVYPPPEVPEAPAKEEVPSKPAAVPPPPIPAHDGKKPNYLAIGILIMAILPILAGLIIVANIMSPASDVQLNSTPVITVSPANTTQAAQTPGTPEVTVSPLPGSVQATIPVNGVWVRVSYPNTYIGLIGTPGNQTEVTDTGDHLYQIPGDDRAVAAILQKKDDSGDQIILEIYKNGVLLKRESSVVPQGIVEILLDLKTP